MKSSSAPASVSIASPPATRRRNRQATEEELVAAAAVAFAEKGYENATTRGIAEAAGCSEGLIQRYFNGKEGLLLAVLKQQGHAERDRFFERPLCSSMIDEAREMMSHGMASMAERSERIRIVLSRVLLDRTFQADFQRLSIREDVRKSLNQRLTRYVDAGLIDPALDVDLVTELLLNLIFQLAFVHRELHQTKATDIQRMVDGFADLFARSVAVVPVTPAVKKSAKKT
jgi:AcrR family transcriptional regulator